LRGEATSGTVRSQIVPPPTPFARLLGGACAEGRSARNDHDGVQGISRMPPTPATASAKTVLNLPVQSEPAFSSPGFENSELRLNSPCGCLNPIDTFQGASYLRREGEEAGSIKVYERLCGALVGAHHRHAIDTLLGPTHAATLHARADDRLVGAFDLS